MSLVNVGHLMTNPRFVEDVTLRRPTVHFANEGEAIASYEPDATIKASVQPMSAKEVAALPEGQRGGGTVYRIYTATALKFSPGKESISDYLVTSKGSLVVVGQEDWSGGGYYKFLAVEYVP